MINLKKYGKALITGASSGIGEQYARKMASLNNDLVLVARRKEKLDTLAKELESNYGVQIDIIQADLSLENDVIRVEKYINQNSDISILINNAGFAVPEIFSESEIDKQLSMIYVHNIACVRLTHASIKYMFKKNKGIIINVASTLAYMPMEKNSIYCASKAFINSFSEVVNYESKDKGIIIQALNPGLTHSNFHSTELFNKLEKQKYPESVWMSVEEVVFQSLKNLGKKVVFIPGLKNRMMVKMYKLLKK
ncbi:SDR family oxidoreductase [Mycoplasmatota bacterium]|nr:SDR family oxidoreductase [Mycoplasmatota bacterium]